MCLLVLHVCMLESGFLKWSVLPVMDNFAMDVDWCSGRFVMSYVTGCNTRVLLRIRGVAMGVTLVIYVQAIELEKSRDPCSGLENPKSIPFFSYWYQVNTKSCVHSYPVSVKGIKDLSDVFLKLDRLICILKVCTLMLCIVCVTLHIHICSYKWCIHVLYIVYVIIRPFLEVFNLFLKKMERRHFKYLLSISNIKYLKDNVVHSIYRNLREATHGMEFSQLPSLETTLPENKLLIFSYLDLLSLTRVATVNKECYIIIRNSNLWKDLFIKRYGLPRVAPSDWRTNYQENYMVEKNSKLHTPTAPLFWTEAHQDWIHSAPIAPRLFFPSFMQPSLRLVTAY